LPAGPSAASVGAARNIRAASACTWSTVTAAIFAFHDWDCLQADVNVAYLHAPLKQRGIYMAQPERFIEFGDNGEEDWAQRRRLL
jgi:hypothetical protein